MTVHVIMFTAVVVTPALLLWIGISDAGRHSARSRREDRRYSVSEPFERAHAQPVPFLHA
jgi:hypothetical protein